ncbi:hypothetical protein [Corallincola spongiicola]|uniref:Histidine kinase domain-containing protein n=1 Tax=Corallincola spongiicola TaxID=2520508 RepID=A0ABY1WP19_9GAMM|nr:hypothetical protein [Corallincola spongiicola]TAA45821.1 hypothetical protein EXY25_10710 [Corallincola spongiicola]
MPSPMRAEEFDRGRVDTLYRQAASLSFVFPTTSLILVAYLCFFTSMPYLPLLSWLELVVLCSVFRWHLTARQKRSTDSPHQWENAYVRLECASGLLAGIICILTMQQPFLLQLVPLLVVVGEVVSAVAVLVMSWRVFCAFALSAILPFSVYWLVAGTQQHQLVALMLMGPFLALTFNTFRFLYKSTTETYRLRVERQLLNAELIDSSKELAAARDKAELNSIAKSDFIQQLGEQLKAPLLGQLACLKLLKAQLEDSRQQPLVAASEQSAAQLLYLIDDLTQISLLEKGEVQVTPETFDLRALLEEVLALTVPTAHLKGLECDAIISAELPNRVTTDRTQLKRILLSMLGQVIQAKDAGNIKLNVSVSSGKLLLRMHETGRCLIRQWQKELLTTTTDPLPGLPMCRQLCQLLQGELQLTHVGAGEVILRCRVPIEVEQGFHVPQPAPELGKVLIVSQSPTLRESVQAQLQSLGCDTHLMADLVTTEALLQQTQTRVNLVLDTDHIPRTVWQSLLTLCQRQGHRVLLVDRFHRLTASDVYHQPLPITQAMLTAWLAGRRMQAMKTQSVAKAGHQGEVLLCQLPPVEALVIETMLAEFGWRHERVTPQQLPAHAQQSSNQYQLIICDGETPLSKAQIAGRPVIRIVQSKGDGRYEGEQIVRPIDMDMLAGRLDKLLAETD